jgi:hypothetical protein
MARGGIGGERSVRLPSVSRQLRARGAPVVYPCPAGRATNRRITPSATRLS